MLSGKGQHCPYANPIHTAKEFSMKKFVTVFCALSMMLSLTACGSGESSTNIVSAEKEASSVTEAALLQTPDAAAYTVDEEAIVGQVTATGRTSGTVLLGEYSMPDMGEGEKPDNGERPEGMPSDMPEGEMPDGENPEKPEGGEKDWGDGEAPERPNGEGGGFGSGRGQMKSFTAGTEALSIFCSQAVRCMMLLPL